MQRARKQRRRGATECRFRVRKFLFILVFFLSGGLVELVRFDSVQSVSDFRNQNRTEP
jgi:hypothetical protein